jgi:hypothetical protein
MNLPIPCKAYSKCEKMTRCQKKPIHVATGRKSQEFLGPWRVGKSQGVWIFKGKSGENDFLRTNQPPYIFICGFLETSRQGNSQSTGIVLIHFPPQGMLRCYPIEGLIPKSLIDHPSNHPGGIRLMDKIDSGMPNDLLSS